MGVQVVWLVSFFIQLSHITVRLHEGSVAAFLYDCEGNTQQKDIQG